MGRRERAREGRNEKVRKKGNVGGLFIGSVGACVPRVTGFYAHDRVVCGATVAVCNGHIVVYGLATAQAVIAAGIEEATVEVNILEY